MNVMIQSRWIGALALLIWDQCHGDETFVETGTLRHHPDIEIELFVAEPYVIDPVALTFDAAGDLYVVEMRDYPYGRHLPGHKGSRRTGRRISR